MRGHVCGQNFSTNLAFMAKPSESFSSRSSHSTGKSPNGGHEREESFMEMARGQGVGPIIYMSCCSHEKMGIKREWQSHSTLPHQSPSANSPALSTSTLLRRVDYVTIRSAARPPRIPATDHRVSHSSPSEPSSEKWGSGVINQKAVQANARSESHFLTFAF